MMSNLDSRFSVLTVGLWESVLGQKRFRCLKDLVKYPSAKREHWTHVTCLTGANRKPKLPTLAFSATVKALPRILPVYGVL